MVESNVEGSENLRKGETETRRKFLEKGLALTGYSLAVITTLTGRAASMEPPGQGAASCPQNGNANGNANGGGNGTANGGSANGGGNGTANGGSANGGGNGTANGGS